MIGTIQDKLQEYFQKEPVTAVYLFGSRATDTAGPLSDYDIGVLFTYSLQPGDRFDKKLQYLSDIAGLIGLNEEHVDMVDLRAAPFPLAFAAISGRLLFCTDQNDRIEFERKTMATMHTDFYYLKRDYKATLEAITQRTFFS